MARPRLNRERYENGRAKAPDMDRMHPALIKRQKLAIIKAGADQRFGYQIGLLCLNGIITDEQFGAADRICIMRAAYEAIYCVPSATTKALDYAAASGSNNLDPVAKRDRSDAYLKAMAHIGNGSPESSAIFHVVFCDNMPETQDTIMALKSGLTKLAKWFEGAR